MDYGKFLNKKEEAVLAYLGGPFAYGKDRRVRVDEPRPPPGFHRFEIKGRNARAIEAVDSPALEGLPRVRGHHVRGWLVSSELKTRAERIELLPAEEPPPLALVRARRWHSGDLVFESLDFDGEPEEAARLKLEQKEALGELKGAALTLRTAYGVALASAVARDVGVDVSVREALSAARRVADEGEPAARPFLVALDARRAEEMERARIHAILAGQRPREVVAYRTPARHQPSVDNAALRAEETLAAADARMLSCRNLGNGNVEVTFMFMSERFISVVDAITLHVYDSGVCLAGADELITLDALPGVIREAIEDDVLVITRR
ncbi:MAG: hypothetical protein KIT84_10175 [Labilithrix sp.]|nr:hypothetical protein [Labilithrix sp.]MCW5811370.1 hypothetical protein [Labilithrix sp.]